MHIVLDYQNYLTPEYLSIKEEKPVMYIFMTKYKYTYIYIYMYVYVRGLDYPSVYYTLEGRSPYVVCIIIYMMKGIKTCTQRQFMRQSTNIRTHTLHFAMFPGAKARNIVREEVVNLFQT